MYAVVANGIQTICKNQRALNAILAFYPYPKFANVANEEQARRWILAHSRHVKDMGLRKYGDTSVSGYASVQYAIEDGRIVYDIDTSRLGYIKIKGSEDAVIDSRKESLKIIVKGITLDDTVITHHIIAIRKILKLVGSYIDIDFVVPDMSIFLAATKYSGKNYNIIGLQRDIENRYGAVSFTVKGIKNNGQ